MKVSDVIVEFLVKNGIDIVFGYPGGNVTHLLDSIYRNGKVNYLQGYHEQACAFAAGGYARVSGKIGVALSSSGPGATNMVTAIADAWFDSIPCLFLCGQVSMHDQRVNDNLRQNGFQEMDIISVVNSITKYAVRVTDANTILYHLEKAIYLAQNGRKGPVLIELPHSIQSMDVVEEQLEHFLSNKINKEKGKFDVEYLIRTSEKLISNAEKPVIFVGAGVRHAGCADHVLMLAKKLHIPIVTSMMGIDLFDKCESILGFVGPSGSPRANYAVSNCDLLIAMGVRLEGQHTSRPEKFAPNAKVIHIDVDQAELDNFERSEIKIQSDVEEVVEQWLKEIEPTTVKKDERTRWLEDIISRKEYYGDSVRRSDKDVIDPNEFLSEVGKSLDDKAIVCVDVGQHLLWVAQSIRYSLGGRFLVSGGLGSMGFAIPTCIGAYYANPNSMPIVIAGDGGIQMNIQELQTIVKYNIPVIIIVLNNHSLGMVRAYQDQWFKHHLGSVEGYLPTPSFEKIAAAYDIPYCNITSRSQLADMAQWFTERKARLIEVTLPNDSMVYSGLKEYK